MQLRRLLRPQAPFLARTAEAVQVHGAWTADRIAAAFIAAVLPPLAGAFWYKCEGAESE